MNVEWKSLNFACLRDCCGERRRGMLGGKGEYGEGEVECGEEGEVGWSWLDTSGSRWWMLFWQAISVDKSSIVIEKR